MLAVSPGIVQPSTYPPRRKQPGTEDAISQTDQPASTPRPISSSSSPGVAGFDQRTRQWLWSPEPGHPIYCPGRPTPSSPGPAGPGAARVLIVVVPASGVHHPAALPRAMTGGSRAGPAHLPRPSSGHGGRGPCTARQSCPVLRPAAPKARLLSGPSASAVNWSSLALFRWEPDGTPPPCHPRPGYRGHLRRPPRGRCRACARSCRRPPGAAVATPHARRPAPWLPARLAQGTMSTSATVSPSRTRPAPAPPCVPDTLWHPAGALAPANACGRTRRYRRRRRLGTDQPVPMPAWWRARQVSPASSRLVNEKTTSVAVLVAFSRMRRRKYWLRRWRASELPSGHYVTGTPVRVRY